MPAATAMWKLLLQSKTLNAASSEEDLHHCLFGLFRLIRSMTDQPGGLTFKNHAGEALASTCWSLFEGTIRRHLKTDNEEGTRIEDVTRSKMSLAQFMDFVRGSAATNLSAFQRRQVAAGLAKTTASLKVWVAQDHFQEDLVPLEVLLQIFGFEMNRPLELWYGHLPEFPSVELGKAVDRLPEATYADLKRRLREYGKASEIAVEYSQARWRASHPPVVAGSTPPGVDDHRGHA